MRILVNPEEFKFEALPAGIYKGAVTAHKVKQSQKGNTYISVEYTIQSNGPDPNINTIGRKVFDTWTMTPESLGIVNDRYKALTGTDLPAGEFELEEFINVLIANTVNKACLLQIELQPSVKNPDQLMNNVKKALPVIS